MAIIPIKTYSQISCGLTPETTRFDMIMGELKDYYETRDLIGGVPLCAEEGMTPQTLKLYIL